MTQNTFIARFFDGKQIQPFSATVELTDSGLSIKIIKNDSELELIWSWRNIQVMEPPHENRDILLGYKETPGARLVLKDKSHYEAIAKNIPCENIKLSSVAHPWRKVMIIVVLTCISITALLIGIPLASPFIAKHVPESWDDKLGQFVIKQTVSNDKECVNPKGKKALQKLIAKLNNASKQNMDVRVVTGEENDINAFAVPGQHIIVFSGLINFADSPDELAGVLAHEMGHAIEHHPTEGLIRSLGISIVMTASLGSSADYVTNLLNLKHSRKAEQAADDIAITLLQQANISTLDFAKFFEKLSKDDNALGENEKYLEYISSHPGLLDRMRHIQQQDNAKNTTSSLSAQEWKDLKEICSQTKALKFD